MIAQATEALDKLVDQAPATYYGLVIEHLAGDPQHAAQHITRRELDQLKNWMKQLESKR